VTDYRSSESELVAERENKEGGASERMLRRATRHLRIRLGSIQEMDVAEIKAEMRGRILFS